MKLMIRGSVSRFGGPRRRASACRPGRARGQRGGARGRAGRSPRPGVRRLRAPRDREHGAGDFVVDQRGEQNGGEQRIVEAGESGEFGDAASPPRRTRWRGRWRGRVERAQVEAQAAHEHHGAHEIAGTRRLRRSNSANTSATSAHAGLTARRQQRRVVRPTGRAWRARWRYRAPGRGFIACTQAKA